jgi:hypothetical protein
MAGRCLIACALVAAASIAPLAYGQKISTPTQAPPVGYVAPRTSYGAPSIEGMWTTNFILPMEASARTPTLTLPEKDAKAMADLLAGEIAASFDAQLDPEVPVNIKNTSGLAVVRGERRTRAVVLPADGRLPYTPEARKETVTGGPSRYDNYEERPNWERCITNLGLPPITFMGSTNIRHIVQTSTHVVLRTEYGDEVRVIPFTATHRPKELHTALGDSIARWDGDTLVIETIGLPNKDRKRAFGNNLLVPGASTVIERLTRVSDTEVVYQFSVVDPTVYHAPWMAEYSIYKSDHQNYEHACHEGNYSLPNILRGARVLEARKAGGRY